MKKRLTALFGLLLFASGLALAYTIFSARQQAARVDRIVPPPGPIVVKPVNCQQAIESTTKLERRVMSEDETQAVTVSLANPGLENCEVELWLNAPFFTMNPPMPERQLTVAAGRVSEIAWILTPQRLGTFEIMVRVNGNITTFGITVTNIFGLRAWQVELLSALGTFLGPMLTLPYWVEQWQKWRRQQERAGQPDVQEQPWRRRLTAFLIDYFSVGPTGSKARLHK